MSRPKGFKHSAETRLKMSNRVVSESTRKLLSLSKLGDNNPSKRPEVREKISLAHRGKTISEETKVKLRSSNNGNDNYLWRGDEAHYRSKHSWMQRHFGSPPTCEHCKKTGLSGHKIHWANISGVYERVRSDWTRLCAACHALYDKQHQVHG